MREVLYKVWDLENKIMYKNYYGVDLKNTKNILAGNDLEHIVSLERTSVKLLQYTGIPDNYKNDIYDNDILLCSWTEYVNEYTSIPCYVHGKVFFDESNGRWEIAEAKTDEIMSLYEDYDKIQVIGNYLKEPNLFEGEETDADKDYLEPKTFLKKIEL